MVDLIAARNTFIEHLLQEAVLLIISTERLLARGGRGEHFDKLLGDVGENGELFFDVGDHGGWGGTVFGAEFGRAEEVFDGRHGVGFGVDAWVGV